MSGWAAYTNALVATKNVSQAAIVGHDGKTWATTTGFAATADEVKAMVAAYKNAEPLRAGGLKVAGTKYITLGCDTEVLNGKKGTGGVIVCKTNKTVVIGVYSAESGIQPGPCSASVQKMAEDLKKKGF
jgi:profilin